MKDLFWSDGQSRFLAVIFGSAIVAIVGMLVWYHAGITDAVIKVAAISPSCGGWHADCVVITTDGGVFNVYDETWAVMQPGGTYRVVEHLHTTGNLPSLGQARPA